MPNLHFIFLDSRDEALLSQATMESFIYWRHKIAWIAYKPRIHPFYQGVTRCEFSVGIYVYRGAWHTSYRAGLYLCAMEQKVSAFTGFSPRHSVACT